LIRTTNRPDRESRDSNDQNKLPPNTERGDNFKQVNVRVSKFFNFRENMKLSLFFEAFNLFNTGNFGACSGDVAGACSIDNNINSPNFKRPINFFGATGFSEPIGIPFQSQFGVRFHGNSYIYARHNDWAAFPTLGWLSTRRMASPASARPVAP
jgi:hypothetical protein